MKRVSYLIIALIFLFALNPLAHAKAASFEAKNDQAQYPSISIEKIFVDVKQSLSSIFTGIYLKYVYAIKS